MGKKVAELNTLSDGNGITGIWFFNEMQDTCNESTNLRKLADVWMSKNRCCQGSVLARIWIFSKKGVIKKI